MADCLTDIRQSLAVPRLISKSDAAAGSTVSTGTGGVSTGTVGGSGSSNGLGELLRKMHSSLVSQIKSVLTHLQVSSLIIVVIISC